MKHKNKSTRHKGSHRIAANHHRHVHKGLSALILGLWIAAAVASATLIGAYLDNRHVIRISTQGINLRADRVSYDDVGKYPFIPGKGHKYVIVHVRIKNTRDTSFDFAPVLQTYLIDGKGHKYYMAPASLSDPIKAGKMVSGEIRAGSLSYLVPTNSSELTFRFELQ